MRAAPSHGHAGAAARLEAALALAALWPTAEACASHQFPLQTHLSVSPSTYLHWDQLLGPLAPRLAIAVFQVGSSGLILCPPTIPTGPAAEKVTAGCL